MANENFYIKSFDNIFVVDPNKVINGKGFPEERNVAQEDLVMYANLECNVAPRSRLLSGKNKQTLENVAIASVNFLKPNGQNYLTTNWTNLQVEGADPNVINSELLGITNITYKCGASFTPTVNITLEDVRGRALFESGNDSVYSVFLNLPYPTFYLTLKGYYGKAVRYTLILQKFQASFDQSSGNFISTLNFVGYKYNILTDIQQGFLLGLPYMYSQQVNTNIQTEPTNQAQGSVDQLNGDNADIVSVVEKRGYKTIQSVYELYKSKNIVSKDFPTLTIDQLVSRLQNFERNILETYGQIDVGKLTDGEAFSGLLSDYLAEIYSGVSPKSWFKEFLNETKYYVVVGRDGKPYKVYTYNDIIIKGNDIKKYDEVRTKLNSLISKHNDILKMASTFGQKVGKKEDVIPVNISSSNMIPEPKLLPTLGFIDLYETTKARFGKNNPTSAEFQSIKAELELLNNIKSSVDIARNSDDTILPQNKQVPFFFRFDGEGFFRDEIFKLEKTLTAKLNAIEENLSAELNNLLKSNQGIGFEPTIRNILAVIFASTDAFLRLMDDVHKKAFDARNDSKKKSVCGEDVKNDPDSPVYPWPLFAKEIPVDGETKFEIKYPGDPDYIFETNAFDYNVWPEVEFVEEYQKGFLEREQDALKPNPQSNETTVNRLLISAFDTANNKSYSDLQINPFLIEIYERIRTIAMYQGFVRNGKSAPIENFVEAFEASNIKIAIGKNSNELTEFLKEFGFGQKGGIVEYESYLSQSAPKAFFVVTAGTIYTPYLKEEIESNFKFIDTELPEIKASIATENNGNEVEETMVKYLQSSDKNELYFTDIIPFVIPNWNKVNLSNGNQNFELNKVLNATKSLFYNTKLKKILNYASDYTLENKGENNKNRPFNFFVNTGIKLEYPTIFQDAFTNLKNRAKNTDSEKKSFYTEGRIDAVNPETGLGIDGRIAEKTSSMLNSPQFIRAIQQGVTNDKANSSNPYVQAAYLFLNSLPLANLKRQYIDSDDSVKDYIGPTFNKFGALHSVPKMWACKIGSIWHRYKTWIETQVDILDSVLGPFDQISNYDPNNFSTSTNYFFTASTMSAITITLTDVVTVPQTANPPLYNDIVNVGFYPVVLNDFYYFFNNENLYEDVSNLEFEIQEKITDKSIMILTNNDSSFFKDVDYDPARPRHFLNYSTISILFKNKIRSANDDLSVYYYSAPSFGSRYSQVSTECFNQDTLEYPVFDNQNVYNGSVRLFWGGTHFGYYPTVNYISEPDEYLSRTKTDSWPFHFILNDLGENVTLDKIEDLFGVFTREELDLFENQFLNFSRSEQQSTTDFNIQSILKKALKVEKDSFLNDDQNILVENFQTTQLLNFNGVINNYINLNTIYQKGNPTNFNYPTFSYFTNNPLPGIKGSADEYTTTTPNSLPTSTLTITLADSQTSYEEAWTSLLLNVGFSTITSATYSDSGSTITDFFVDNNIAFTTENVERFAGLIKIYATKKTLNPFYNNSEFIQDVTTHITNTLNLRNTLFEGVFGKIQRALQSSSTQIEKIDDSKTQGNVTKLEYYNLFKAMNDKWIAGNNYSDETMFEDILLLDRANRDIGNKVVVDIFSVMSYLKKNPKASIFNIVSSILEQNHFVIYNMPTYINFYGCQNVDDTPSKEASDNKDFANSLFGTYTEVDYQKSKTKMVCQYVEQPSEQTNNPNVKNAYKDDSWDFEQAPKNPLVESSEKKDNFGLSNKAVGFNVDFGVQNQGVFTNVQVGQDIGKPTSESLKMEYELANLAKGTNTATQNVSLINIYKTRSYSSTVTSMGNAMIQPTMYFVLRNIPLFSGPYLITEVNHVITASDFKTTMVGTRQKVYTPPIKNSLLETIRQNFVKKLKNDLKTKRQAEKVASNTIQKKNSIANNVNSKETPSPNKICKVNDKYSNYASVNASETTTSTRDMLQLVSSRIRAFNSDSNSGDSMNFVVTTLFYIESYNGQSFKYFNNNPSQIPIGSGTTAWGGELASYFNKEYICLNDSQNNSQAYAVFPTIENAIDFNYSKYLRVFIDDLLNVENENVFVTGFTKTWIEKFPQDNTAGTSDIYQNFVKSYPDELTKLQEKVRASYKLVNGYLPTI